MTRTAKDEGSDEQLRQPSSSQFEKRDADGENRSLFFEQLPFHYRVFVSLRVLRIIQSILPSFTAWKVITTLLIFNTLCAYCCFDRSAVSICQFSRDVVQVTPVTLLMTLQSIVRVQLKSSGWRDSWYD